nr:hypothetical protein GCM10025732_53280 [Glycomyces mayteni]
MDLSRLWNDMVLLCAMRCAMPGNATANLRPPVWRPVAESHRNRPINIFQYKRTFPDCSGAGPGIGRSRTGGPPPVGADGRAAYGRRARTAVEAAQSSFLPRGPQCPGAAAPRASTVRP